MGLAGSRMLARQDHYFAASLKKDCEPISALYHPTFFLHMHSFICDKVLQINLWHFRDIGMIHTQLFRKIYRVWAIKIMRIMWVVFAEILEQGVSLYGLVTSEL